jgi:ketosteroid isomerase-like protein
MSDAMTVERSTASPPAADTNDWPARFFSEVDSFSVDRLLACFADDVEVRFGNQPALHGKAAARAAFSGFYSTIAGMRHEAETVVISGDLATQQAIVIYTRKDGQDIRLPVASHLRRTPDGLVNRLWIYIDMAPLFAPAA